METAKVDIKKLQILSDRINQCIDALNQVRISVHGLAQSNPFTQGALGTQGFGQVPGLSHSSPFGIGATNPMFPVNSPYAGLGAAAQGFPGVGPTGFGQQGLGQQGFGQQGLGQLGQFGLSHTNPEGIEAYSGSTWNDPFLAARVTQTFPYLKFALPPIVALY